MSQRGFQDQQEALWTFLRGVQGNDSLAIFVHGFRGNYLTTWGRLPELLDKFADSDPTLCSWDFLFLGYRTRSIATYLDIARLISGQWEMASTGQPPFDVRYKRLSLFGHSLGTLGIRQLLCAKSLHPRDMLTGLHSVMLFGTPLNGSPLAPLGSLVGGAITKALEPGNPQLRMLHSWTESIHATLDWRKVKIVLGTDDRVVGYQYADMIKFAGDESNPLLLNFGHRALVKPVSWNDSIVRDLIVGALQ